MALGHDRRLLCSNVVLDNPDTSYVDALRVESLQGSARRARRTRAASTEQSAIFSVSDKREGN